MTAAESDARTKVCSSCSQALPLDAFHRRRHYVTTTVRAACKACTAKSVAAAREAARGKPTTEEQRLKERVRARTARAVVRGELIPLPCAVCGSDESEAHHPSYVVEDAHLKVEWLCRDHHMTTHVKAPWGKQMPLPL